MKMPQPRPVVPPPLLEGLDGTHSKAVLATASCRQLAPRTVLCRQGDRADLFFLVRDGRVRFARTTSEGHDVLLRWLAAGDCFGMASLLPDVLHYMGTGMTIDAATLYVWEGPAIQAAAATYPRLAQNALRVALRYVEEFSARHVALLSRTAEQRVATTLTHLGATNGRILPTGVEVDITNQELASLADVGMFTVSRQMKRWERAGHLIKQRQRVLIRHPDGLLES